MARLSDYFKGVAIKRLSVVETDNTQSHQHEFNGAKPIVALFGIPSGKVRINCEWIYFGEAEEDTFNSSGQLTWYDAREAHETRTEYRLYYQDNEVISHTNAGDLLIIGQKDKNNCLVIICKKGSSYESQLLWLFGLLENDANELFITKTDQIDIQIGFAERQVLEAIGIEVKVNQESWLDLLIDTFDGSFPSTKEFSNFARSTFEGVNSKDDPDEAIIGWVNHEEMLFRTLEEHIVGRKVKTGFKDVDSFVEFSLSVQNRRKSRMGHALENHLQQIFIDHLVVFERGKVTENNSKPDFLFPGTKQYHDYSFPEEKLFMLGAKSTCKDRWRQVLAEASRIKNKHLFTLEPGISKNQTDEMVINSVQLVLPIYLHSTFTHDQRKNIISLSDFIRVVT